MRVMGTGEPRTNGRRLVYVQCKVRMGWGPLKFRDAGGAGSRHPSSLGARCRPVSPDTSDQLRILSTRQRRRHRKRDGQGGR